MTWHGWPILRLLKILRRPAVCGHATKCVDRFNSNKRISFFIIALLSIACSSLSSSLQWNLESFSVRGSPPRADGLIHLTPDQSRSHYKEFCLCQGGKVIHSLDSRLWVGGKYPWLLTFIPAAVAGRASESRTLFRRIPENGGYGEDESVSSGSGRFSYLARAKCKATGMTTTEVSHVSIF